MHLSWEIVVLVALALFALAFTGVVSTTLIWMLRAWSTPEPPDLSLLRQRPGIGRSFSLIVPARHEPKTLGATLDSLARLAHRNYEVIVVVGHDDHRTEVVARAIAARYPRRIRVVIDSHIPQSKPKALNTALEYCRGEITGVFDVENEVHPDMLTLVQAKFSETDADVVQAGVHLMSARTTWWSLRSWTEHYFWFRSQARFQAEQRFIPLSGTAIFAWTELLAECGGWDSTALAEGCEIGVRLSTEGARVAVAYHPQVVATEESPGSLAEFISQRTRRNQGYLRVLLKGEWRNLPRFGQRIMAEYTLAVPFLSAFVGVIAPTWAVAALLVGAPPLVVVLALLPLVPMFAVGVVELIGLRAFARSSGMRARFRDVVRLVLGAFPYQVLLAIAGARSLVRQASGRGTWEKRAHAGAHRKRMAARHAAVSGRG